MNTIKLEKKYNELYLKIISEGTMEDMFEFAYHLGREKFAKEMIKMMGIDTDK